MFSFSEFVCVLSVLLYYFDIINIFPYPLELIFFFEMVGDVQCTLDGFLDFVRQIKTSYRSCILVQFSREVD